MPIVSNHPLLAGARHALAKGDTKSAIQYSRLVLDQVPEQQEALLILGSALAQAANLDEGIPILEKLLILDPTNVPGLNWLAAMYRQGGRFADAITMSQRAVAAAPSDAESHYNLGLCLAAALEPDEAVSAFERAALLNPRTPLYRQTLVATLVRAGQNARAEGAIRDALRFGSTDPKLVGTLVHILRTAGRSDEARQQCHHAYESTQQPMSVIHALVEVNEADMAEELLQRLLKEDPNHASGLTCLGELLQQKGRFAEANAYLDHAMEVDPNAVQPYYLRFFRNRTTESDRPRVTQMSALAREPHRTPEDRKLLHYALGKAYDDLGEYEAAIAHFDKANHLALQLDRQRQPTARTILSSHIDQQVGTFTKEFFARNRDIGNPSELPIFIVGMMRSGTTLVKQILSGHPEVGAGSEIQFWAESDRQCLASDGSLDPERVRQLSQEYLSLLQDIGHGSLRVTDKMPHNYLVLGRIHSVFPNAKIIHCRRNPIDTALSVWFTPFQHSTGYTYDRDDLVFALRQYQRMMDHWREVLPPGTMLEVDYEALVTDNERVVREIVDFCGLEWSEACLRHHENKASIYTASVWQARQSVNNRSVDRWRRYEPWLGPFRDLLDERQAA